MKTIEQQIADVILERDVTSIEIGGVTYNVAPPSIATLIMISELVSTLPAMEQIDVADPDRNIKIFHAVLRNARHYSALGDIAAILILGAKGMTEKVTTYENKPFLFGLLHRKVKVDKVVNRRAELARIVLENVSAATLFDLLLNKINRLDLGNFFAITTSLTEVNILKPTKEVVV